MELIKKSVIAHFNYMSRNLPSTQFGYFYKGKSEVIQCIEHSNNIEELKRNLDKAYTRAKYKSKQFKGVFLYKTNKYFLMPFELTFDIIESRKSFF